MLLSLSPSLSDPSSPPPSPNPARSFEDSFENSVGDVSVLQSTVKIVHKKREKHQTRRFWKQKFDLVLDFVFGDALKFPPTARTLPV